MADAKDKSFYCEVCLAGAGGQGLQLAGVILARAVALYEDRKVIMTSSYGPEARGGASKTELIISQEEIIYPKPTSLDIVLIMSSEAADKFGDSGKDGGILIADSTFVMKPPREPWLPFPITRTARAEFGTPLVSNIIALGILCGVTGIVKEDSLREAVAGRVPPRTKEINLAALARGIEMGKEKAQAKA
ncbi:MAG: 2-oxoacid:ferredoxin oxidoreductase subunit gamma [Planctomycetota bacterium]|nr:MAG: 2-oxoacid:ferredoxin oxidoreductase subunit gamma [Planctomycetota bacterium]